MPLLNPIATIVSQTADILASNSASSNFLGLIIVENPAWLPLIGQTNNSFQTMRLTDFLTHKFSQYYDLAVLILDNEINAETVTAISRSRDMVARHSLIFAPVIQGKSHAFIAFGFSKLSQEKIPFNKKEFFVWQFNLYDYKQLPDWLNSRFWANPENWDKFRW